ncbi:hypothetical protein [Leptolyngbya phage Lbo-JY46]
MSTEKRLRFMNENELVLCYGKDFRHHSVGITQEMVDTYFKDGAELTKVQVESYDSSNHIFNIGGFSFIKDWVLDADVPRLNRLINLSEICKVYMEGIEGFSFNKIESKNEDITILHLNFKGYKLTIDLNLSPTNNCQVFSVRSLDGVLGKIKANETLLIAQVLLLFIKYAGKPIISFDVRRVFLPYLLPLIKPGEHFDYVSSNLSRMSTGIIRKTTLNKVIIDKALEGLIEKESFQDIKFFVDNDLIKLKLI